MAKLDGKSFWMTAPGIMTAAAGLVTALGGLLFTFYQIGWIGNRTEESGPVADRLDRVFVVGEVNDELGKPLGGATIRAINTVSNSEIGKELTDELGRFEMKLEFNRHADRIKLVTEKGGYRKYTLVLGTEEVSFSSILIKSQE
jgi:hypothetical protein